MFIESHDVFFRGRGSERKQHRKTWTCCPSLNSSTEPPLPPPHTHTHTTTSPQPQPPPHTHTHHLLSEEKECVPHPACSFWSSLVNLPKHLPFSFLCLAERWVYFLSVRVTLCSSLENHVSRLCVSFSEHSPNPQALKHVRTHTHAFSLFLTYTVHTKGYVNQTLESHILICTYHICTHTRARTHTHTHTNKEEQPGRIINLPPRLSMFQTQSNLAKCDFSESEWKMFRILVRENIALHS